MRLILNLVLMLLVSGCAMFAGIGQSLSEMDDTQFVILEKQIYLISNRGFVRLFSEKPEAKEAVAFIAEMAGPYLDDTDPNTVLFITNLADTILLKIEDPDVKFILELALLEVQRYGGLSYIDVGEVLNVRSVKLVQAILKGLVEALDG